MTSHPPHPRLRSLVDRLHDGPPLSKPEVAELEELLEDDGALAYYLAISQQEALLSSAIPRTAPSLVGPVQHKPSTLSVVRILAPLAAACIVFALGLRLGLHLERRPGDGAPITVATSSPPARITGMVGVEWADEGAPHQIDLDTSSNPISIKSGLVEVTYASGVRVTLEGPAVYEVAGHETGRLLRGKLYTTVPKGAEGFLVHYSGGTLEDLGTEFAMEALPDGRTEVGVFVGKVKLHSSGRESITLFENQSLLQSPDAQEPLQPLPLNREKYVQRMPARDFRWEVDWLGSREVTFDVTHLVWKPAQYRAIFKWISGPDAIVVRDVRLLCDGEPVAKDGHEGSTGLLRHVSGNIYALDVDPAAYQRGRWTVSARIESMTRTGGLEKSSTPICSRGILQFEEGLVTGAGPEEFIGRWSYHHMGSLFVREFHPDGSVSFETNGVRDQGTWADSRWEVVDGVLQVSIPRRGFVERHVLRNPQTLVFISNPYENAIKDSGNPTGLQTTPE